MHIVIAIIILAAVIMFHELGHFLAARASGVTVVEFAFGFGPRILSKTKGETTYSWRAFPIGGMCQMLGEDEDNHAQGSFQSAKIWQRILIVAMGPLFNFLLALIVAMVVIFSVGADPADVISVDAGSTTEQAGLREGDRVISYEGSDIMNARELSVLIQMDGVPKDTVDLVIERDGERKTISYQPATETRYMLGYTYNEDESPAEILSLIEGLPMKEAGLQPGDIITAFDGNAIENGAALSAYFKENPMDGSPIAVTYLHNGREKTAELVPEYYENASIGFVYNMAREKQDFFSSIAYSFGEVRYWLDVTVKSLARLVTGRFSVRDMSGPVGIVSAVGKVYEQAAPEGWFVVLMNMLNMLILISANLGIMNLIPFPALDGGRLIFLIVEAIRRKPVRQSIEGMVHFIGFAALIALMIFIVFQDIGRLF